MISPPPLDARSGMRKGRRTIRHSAEQPRRGRPANTLRGRSRSLRPAARLQLSPAVPRAILEGAGTTGCQLCAGTSATKPSAIFLERWQSGRMRRIRNPVYGYAVTWVRIPPSPPETRTPLMGRFAFPEKWWCERPRSGRPIRPERIWTPKAAPSAARGEAYGRAEQPHPLPETTRGRRPLCRFWTLER